MIEWYNVLQYLPQLLQGFSLTLLLVVSTIACGLSLSLLLTFCLERRLNPILSAIINTYIFIFRGTPLIVQIFIIYYGFGQAEFIQHSWLWFAFKQSFFCAILALTLNTGAYATTLFVGVIDTIDKGEIEAGQAFGLSNLRLYQHVILPRLFALVMPAYSNEIVIIVKSTSLVSAIAIAELTSVTKSLIGKTYLVIPLLLASGIIYLIVNSLLNMICQRIHRRLH